MTSDELQAWEVNFGLKGSAMTIEDCRQLEDRLMQHIEESSDSVANYWANILQRVYRELTLSIYSPIVAINPEELPKPRTSPRYFVGWLLHTRFGLKAAKGLLVNNHRAVNLSPLLFMPVTRVYASLASDRHPKIVWSHGTIPGKILNLPLYKYQDSP